MKKKLFAILLPTIACLASCSSFFGDTSGGGAKSSKVDNPFSVSTPEATEYYIVNIHIDFEENLFLSKYDVDFYVDGQMKGTLKHGKNQDFTLSLGNFDHTLLFAKNGDPSIFSAAVLGVSKNILVTYEIKTHSSTIDVELTSIRNLDGSSDASLASSTSATDSSNSSGAVSTSSTSGNNWYDKQYTLTKNTFGYPGELDIVIESWNITAQTISIQGSITQTVINNIRFTFYERGTLYYDQQNGSDDCRISQNNDVNVTAYLNSKTTFNLSYHSPTNLRDCVGITALEISGSYGGTVDGVYQSEEIGFILEFTYQ